MDRDEQVGLHAPRLLHALVQRHEEVGVSRQHGAHRGIGVDAVAQQHRDGEHHVLFAQPGRADGAWIFAAMAGVERDDDEPVDSALRHLWRQCGLGGRGHRDRPRRRTSHERRRCRVGRCRPDQRRHAHLADELAERVLHVLRGALLRLLLVADQVEQWVTSFGRVEIEHEAIAIRCNRLERKQLRRGGLLEVDHQPYDARLALANAHAGDEGIVAADLADELTQLRAELEAVDVDHQALGAGREKVACGERRVGLDGDARVVGCRPDAHRDDGGAENQLGCGEAEYERAHAAQRGAA